MSVNQEAYWSDALNGADVDITGNHVVVRGHATCTNLDMLNDDVVFDLFKQYGSILFRGFGINYMAFDSMTKRHCSSFLSQVAASRKTLNTDPATQTVNLGNDSFPYHPELSQFPWQPDIAWFCCAQTPEHRNEGTIICDGIELANILDAEDRDLLANNQLVYTIRKSRDSISKVLDIKLPEDDDIESINDTEIFTFKIRDDELWVTYTCPGLRIPVFSESLAFNNFMIFSRLQNRVNHYPMLSDGTMIPDELIHRISSKADTIATQIDWRKGDLLMLNNTRFMHARPSVIDPAKRFIITRFGYARRHPERKTLSQRCPWRREGIIFSQTNGII